MIAIAIPRPARPHPAFGIPLPAGRGKEGEVLFAAVAAVFKRPFDEQVAFFRGKLGTLVPTQTWRDLSQSAHDRAFMVAGAAQADLLADLAGAVDKAVAEGETLPQFRARFGEIVTRNGWHGWTGEGSKAGEAWRTRVIYQTNLSTSYAAGRLAQLKDGDYPLWIYRHSDASQVPRPEHLAWDGLTLPPDDPFWKTHSPPNGWGCKCRMIGARSAAQAKRFGGDPDKPLPAGWERIDPATGAPVGIDEGWDSQPGETVSDTVRSAAKKTVQWDYQLAKAYMDGVPAAQRDALATAIRAQPETGEAVRRYAQRVLSSSSPPVKGESQRGGAVVPPYQTMGLLTTDEAQRIADLTGVEAVASELYDWTVDASTVGHILRAHGTGETETLRGQAPIVAADYVMLPRLILAARQIEDAGISDVGLPAVAIEESIERRRYRAVFEVRQGRRMLVLQSFLKGTEKKR